MKTFHLNQFKAAFAAVLFFAIQSCVLKPGTWKNERISDSKRDKFHELNAEAIGYLKANNARGLKMMCSKEMNASNNERQVYFMSNRLSENAFDVMDEYYIVHKSQDGDTVPMANGDTNRYSLNVPYEATEMYMAYLIPKKPANKYMLSFAYAKLSYGWKLVKMDAEPYTVNGKTAPQLYALAKAQYDKKEIQAAVNNVALANTCFSPGLYWNYPEKADAQSFYERINAEVEQQYRYPLILKQLATGPMVLRVYTKTDENGTFPMIYYMTHFPLKDTTEVKKENLQVRDALAKLMPGLTDNNKYIYYSAFNKQPTGYTTVDHFDMTHVVNK